MSMEFPIGTEIVHKTAKDISFVVVGNQSTANLICRRVDAHGIVQTAIFTHQEIIKKK